MADLTISRLGNKLWASQGSAAVPEFTGAQSSAAWIPDMLAWMMNDAQFFDIHMAPTAPADLTKLWFRTHTVTPSVNAPGKMQRHNGTAWEDLTQAGFLSWLTARLAISGGSSGYLDGSAANGKLWVSTSTGTTVDVSDWLSYNATTGALSFAEKNIDLSQKLTKNDATKTLSVSHDGGSVDLSSWGRAGTLIASAGVGNLFFNGSTYSVITYDSTKRHYLDSGSYYDGGTSSTIYAPPVEFSPGSPINFLPTTYPLYVFQVS